MRYLDPLTEYKETEQELSSEELELLLELGKISITPVDGVSRRYILKPSSWIGVVNLGTLCVEIRPKIPLDRVLFLASYALDPKAWRSTSVSMSASMAVHEAVIPAFLLHANNALRNGLLQGYREVEESLHTIRGRIRFADQIRYHYGVAPPIEVRYDDYTVDILLNQLIKTAILHIGYLPIRKPKWRNNLRKLNELLEGVNLLEDYIRIPDITWSRLNSHYRPVTMLARLILSGSSFEARMGKQYGRSLFFDMNKLFENFVVIALREALGLHPSTFRQGDESLRLDKKGRITLKPDLTWWFGQRCLFVGDVKYKRTKEKGKNPDLYQLLAYTIAADVPGGILIYAASEGEHVTHTVVHAGKQLEVMPIHLGGEPEEILAEICRVASHIRRRIMDRYVS